MSWYKKIPSGHPGYVHSNPAQIEARIIEYMERAYNDLPYLGNLKIKLMPTAHERTTQSLRSLLALSSKMPLDPKFEKNGRRCTDPVFLLWKWAKQLDNIDVERGEVLSFVNGWCPLRIVSLRISWAVITEQAITAMLSMTDKFIDLGAGSGYLAYRLKRAGAKHVVAVDQLSDVDSLLKWQLFHPCVQADYCKWMAREAGTGKYDDYALVFCWPRKTCEMLTCIQTSGWRGTHIAVIAETADDSGSIECLVLAGYLKRINRISLPNWRGARDRLILYERVCNDL